MKRLTVHANVLALATVAALTVAPAFAQQPQRGPGFDRAATIDRSALVDARIAAIRAGLRLTPEQEPIFAPVEDALRSAAETRETRRAERRERVGEMRERMGDERGEGRMGAGRPGEGRPGEGRLGEGRPGEGRMRGEGRGDGPMREGFADGADFMERLERRAARAEEIGALATAMRPLWDSLDDGQQAILPVLLRETGAIGQDRRGGGYRGDGHHGRMHGRG